MTKKTDKPALDPWRKEYVRRVLVDASPFTETLAPWRSDTGDQLGFVRPGFTDETQSSSYNVTWSYCGDGDEPDIDISIENDPGYQYSEYTREDPYTEVSIVGTLRNGQAVYYTLRGDDEVSNWFRRITS